MLRRLTGGSRRILMTVDAVGGVWQYALGLAGELARGGDRIVLAGLGPGPSADQRRQAESVATLTWLAAPPEWLATEEDELAGLADELAALARDHAVDIVHLNAPAQAAGLRLPCPVVAVSHSCVATWFQTVRGSGPDAAWAWQGRRNRQGFDRADVTVAPSASHAAMLRRCYGDIPNLRVVHNAVPATAARQGRDDFVFAAGRWWDDGKDAPTLDAAAARLGWPLLAAGATRGPNGQSVSFRHATPLGTVAHDEVRRLMASCGLFVSPSVYEPFGLAALEAAWAATPLVLADIPTYRELWDDAAAFFPPRDADALAALLGRLVADPGERRRLGEAARRRAGRFTPARQAAATRAVYDRASLALAGGR